MIALSPKRNFFDATSLQLMRNRGMMVNVRDILISLIQCNTISNLYKVNIFRYFFYVVDVYCVKKKKKKNHKIQIGNK